MAETGKIIDVDLTSSRDIKEKIINLITHPIIISIIIVVIGAIAITIAILKTRIPELPQAPFKEAAIGQLNNPKVTIETYEDFVCPHCGEFNPIYNELVNNYKDKSVKIIFHNYPFLSSNSQTAAEASEYANDKGKFEEMKNKIFEEQTKAYQAAGKEDPSFAKLDNLVEWGSSIGLDANDMRKNLEGRTYKTRVNNSVDAAKARGVNSTPTVYINNNLFVADASKGIYLDTASISKIVDSELLK